MFLNEQKIDIILISETHATTQTYIKIRGYKWYQSTHPSNKARGGSAILIKDNIDHYEECHIQLAEFQLTVVGIKSMKQKIKIGALYSPPRHNIKKEEYKHLLRNLGERFIIGGDFNAKHTHWGSRLTNTKGKELFKAISEMGCNVHSTGKPTYWPEDRNKIPDLLDFFISRKISSNFIDVEDNFDLNSDHSPVIMTLSDIIIRKENKPLLVNKTTDWESFRTELDNDIELNIELKTKQQIEEAAEKFTSSIQKAAWNNTRQLTQRKIGTNYPMQIRELVNEKRKARRRWQQTRDPSDKNILNNKTQKLKREIKKFKEESVQTHLENMSAEETSNYSLWKATKKIKRPVTQIPPIQLTDGSWARTYKEKADLFAEYLADTFKPNDIVSDIDVEDFTNLDNDDIPFVSPKEVANEIEKNINPKKAPGYDLITGEILKRLPDNGIIMLSYIINAIIRLKYVPRIWKVSEISMIPKPGKPPNDVSSYRPISLLPIMSKLFEKLLLKRLTPIIEKKSLIPNHQFGFRHKHSTIDQVHRITNLIEKALEEKMVCSTIFLDVAQAFDKVWHQGLIYKLNKHLPKSYVELLSSYLSERLCRVKQENEYSELKEIQAGIPQGSVLGPVLYLLYTCDIPQSENVTVATFADDTAILALDIDPQKATEKLQNASDKIGEWSRRWKIKINAMKPVHVNFTNRKIEHTCPLVLNGVVIPIANTAKYLAMTLDAKLKWKEHVKKKRIELDIRYKELYWLLKRKSQLPIQYKLMIYNQILKPIWLYGIQLWGCASKSNIKCIQTFQNKVLRNMVGAPWYIRNSDLHRDLGVRNVDNEIARSASKHESRLHRHVNVEALQLLDNQNLIRRLKRTKTFELVK